MLDRILKQIKEWRAEARYLAKEGPYKSSDISGEYMGKADGLEKAAQTLEDILVSEPWFVWIVWEDRKSCDVPFLAGVFPTEQKANEKVIELEKREAFMFPTKKEWRSTFTVASTPVEGTTEVNGLEEKKCTPGN